MTDLKNGTTTHIADVIDKELRLRRIEEQLEQRALNNDKTDTVRRETTAIPAPTGLHLVPNVGTITAEFNPVDADIRYYDVQVAQNQQMANPTSIQTSDYRFTYAEGDPEVTYYIRVRAVTTDNRVGPWSGILNTETGMVFTEIIEVAATTNLASEDLTSGFTTWTESGGTSSRTYGSCAIETIDGSVVLPFTVVVVDYTCTYAAGDTMRMTVDFLRDGDVVDSASVDFRSDVSTQARLPISSFATADVPGAGVHHYSIKYTLTLTGGTASTITLDFIRQIIELVEIKR